MSLFSILKRKPKPTPEREPLITVRYRFDGSPVTWNKTFTHREDYWTWLRGMQANSKFYVVD